ncbi:unnamed protein product [Closterium sp. NIES-54]
MFITLYFIVTRASRGTPRTPFFEGCSPSPLAPSYASAAAVDVPGAVDVGAASASAKRRSSKGKGGRGGGGGSGSGSGGSGGGGGGSGGGGSSGSGDGSGGFGSGGRGSGGGGGSGSGGRGGGRNGAQGGGSGGGQRQQQQLRSKTYVSCPYVIRTGDRAGQTCGRPHTQRRCFSRLDNAWRTEFGDEVECPRCADLFRAGVAIFDVDFDVILASMYALSTSAEGDYYRCVPPDPGIGAAALGASEYVLPGTAPTAALHTFTLDSSASRCFFRDSTTLTPLSAPIPVRLADPSGGPVVARASTLLPCPAFPSGFLSGLHLPSFSTNLVSTAALQDVMVTTTTSGGQRVSICTCAQTGRHLATFTRRPGSSLYTLATEPNQVAASAQVSASDQVAPPCSCCLVSHQTLLWHHCLGHPSLPRLRGMHSFLFLSSLPRSLPPLPPSPAPPCLPCVKGRQRAAPHSSFPPTSAPLLTLHMDVGGEFSSDQLRDFCHGEGILKSFTLPASPQQNGIAERHIDLVMEVARTSMIHAVAPHFLWSFAVRYAARQLNLWPRISLPETSPTQRWTGKVGDASVFRVWGSRAFVRDTSADKLSTHAIPCRSAHLPPPPLFLAPGPPPVDPLPAQGPAPLGVSKVDPPPGAVSGEVAVDSGAARGATSGGAETGGAELGGDETRGVEPEGAKTGGAEPGGAEPEGVESGGVEPGGAEPMGMESGGAEPRGTASSGGPAGVSPWLSPRPEPLSPQQLHEWLTRRARLRSGAAGASDTAAGDAGAGSTSSTGVSDGAGGTGGAGPTGPGGAHTRGIGAAGIGGAGGAGAGGAGIAGGTGASGDGGTTDVGARGAGPGGAGAGSGDTGRSRPYFVPLLHQSASPLPAPCPYTEHTGGLTKRREPEYRHASLVRTGRCVPRPHPPPFPGTHAMALRPSSVPLRVPLPNPPESSLLAVTNPSFEPNVASVKTVILDQQRGGGDLQHQPPVPPPPPSPPSPCCGCSGGGEGICSPVRPAALFALRALLPCSPVRPAALCTPRALRPARPAALCAPRALLSCCPARHARPAALRALRALLPCSPVRPAALQPCAPCCPAALCAPRALQPCAPRAPCCPASLRALQPCAPRAPCCPAALCALLPCSPVRPAALCAPRALQPCAPRATCCPAAPHAPCCPAALCAPLPSPAAAATALAAAATAPAAAALALAAAATALAVATTAIAAAATALAAATTALATAATALAAAATALAVAATALAAAATALSAAATAPAAAATALAAAATALAVAATALAVAATALAAAAPALAVAATALAAAATALAVAATALAAAATALAAADTAPAAAATALAAAATVLAAPLQPFLLSCTPRAPCSPARHARPAVLCAPCALLPSARTSAAPCAAPTPPPPLPPFSPPSPCCTCSSWVHELILTASALVAELVDFATASRLDYATALVAESASATPPSVGGECALC